MRSHRALLMGLVAATAVASAHTGSSQATAEVAPRAATALVLHYTFDSDQQGVVRDASINALHGTLINAASSTAYTASVAGRGKALRLVGADHQFVDVPQSDVLDVDSYTLAALVRYTRVPNDQTLGRWEVLEKAGAYWLNIRTTGRVRVGGFYGDCNGGAAWQYLDSSRPIPINTWTHVASTYNQSRLTVWINGERAGSKAVSGTTCSNDEPLAIGAKNAPAKGLLEAFYDGLLDDVRIYKHALTATRIRALVPL